MLQEMYKWIIETITIAREKEPLPLKSLSNHEFKPSDMVLLHNVMHAKHELAPKYIPNYHIIKHMGDKSVDIVDQIGKQDAH